MLVRNVMVTILTQCCCVRRAKPSRLKVQRIGIDEQRQPGPYGEAAGVRVLPAETRWRDRPGGRGRLVPATRKGTAEGATAGCRARHRGASAPSRCDRGR